MNMPNLDKLMNKNYIILIVPIIILIIFLAMYVSVPPYSEGEVYFEDFSVILPDDAIYNDRGDDVKVTGPAREYVSEIYKTDNYGDLYYETLQELDTEGYIPYIEDFNDTHYAVLLQLDVPVLSDVNGEYYSYTFILPKNSYDDTTFNLISEKDPVWIIKATDLDFASDLRYSINFGD